MKIFKTYLFLAIFFIVGSFDLHAQDEYTTIQDPNFASYLCETFPEIANSECSKFKIETDTPIVVNGTLDFRYREISNISEINKFFAVDTIYGEYNNISGDLLFTSSSLNLLNLSHNELTQMPRFEVDSVEEALHLFLTNNQIEVVSDLNSVSTALITLDLDSNLIFDLPSFQSFDSLATLSLKMNYLTFEDLVPLLNAPISSDSIILFPQREIVLPNTVYREESKNYTFKLPVDAEIDSNTYKWYKNDILISTTTINELSFMPLELVDAGNYRVEITNSSFTGANELIRSEIFRLEVLEQEIEFDPSILVYETNPSCNDFSITFEASSIQEDYELALIHENGSYHPLKSNSLSELPFGHYDLQAISKRGTVSNSYNWLIQLKNESCSNVITPNGDGDQDKMYFDGTGKALIFNSTGKEVRRIKLPGEWEGTDSNNMLLESGLYYIQLNSDSIQTVTILR